MRKLARHVILLKKTGKPGTLQMVRSMIGHHGTTILDNADHDEDTDAHEMVLSLTGYTTQHL